MKHLEQTALAVQEGGKELRAKFILCTNGDGAATIMNRSRQTIWRLCQTGGLRSYPLAGNLLIPLADIGRLLGRPEKQILEVARTYGLPIWQAYQK